MDFPEPAIGEREMFDLAVIFVPGDWVFPDDVNIGFFGIFCDAGIRGNLRDGRATPAGLGSDPAPDRAL
jgi:hypothetical protein